MDPITQQTVIAAAGAAKGDPVYVDDVFSTYLWEGDSEASQTITNGIDLAGEGGLVWVKGRTVAYNNILFDTERGNTSSLKSNTSDAAETISTRVSGFLSNGFTVGSNGNVNAGSVDYASWSFRKAPGFFDVVTYSGNDVAGRGIAHNLGSVPGCIIVKAYSADADWHVYHRSVGTGKFLTLNSTSATTTNAGSFSTTPTSTVFYPGTSENGSGYNYVAYIFAHDDQSFGTDSDESIIKCGTFSTDGSQNATVTGLGWEPQWVLFKRTSTTGDWRLHDSMRNLSHSGYALLNPNTTGAEASHATVTVISATPDGFEIQNTNANSDYIYIAIRRPHKPPTAATEVFDDVIYNGTAGVQNIVNSLLYTDLTWIKRRTSTDPPVITDRLRGDAKYFKTNLSDAASTWASNDLIKLDKMYSFGLDGNATGYINSGSQPYISWNFKRAPGFFDVVAYNGSGSATNHNHNLEAVPELMLIKRRDTTGNWVVYAEGIGASPAASYFLYLQSNDARGSSGNFFDDTAPTSSVFRIGGSNNVNNSSGKYIAYLFATLPGISKVGSYTGTGSAINVDCGFTSGARFVLIKRTDSNGNWVLFDSTRGIVSGNDPYLRPNSTQVETTDEDHIGPLNAGFTVSASSEGDTNASGGSYIFLAIA